MIGAGIIGVSAAYVLSERGYRVTLFDRAEPGRTGPSFGNAGHVVGSAIFPLAEPGIALEGLSMLRDPEGPLKIPPSHLPAVMPWLWRFWRSSYGAAYESGVRTLTAFNAGVIDDAEALYDRARIPHVMRRTPAVYLYESERTFRASKSGWDRRIAAGLKSTPVSADEIRALEPNLAPIFTHGMISHDWAIVTDPFAVVSGLFAAATARGVSFERMDVTAVSDRDGGVTVTAGRIDRPFDATLITAGVWSKTLAERLGERLPVEAERGYNLTYPNPAATVQRPLVLADRGVVVTALEPGLRLGGWSELGGTKLPPIASRWERMRAITEAVLPGLRGADAVQWMGHRPSMPDSIPVLSRSTRHHSVFYAVGHGHYGLSQSAKTARVIGELIGGDRPDAALSAHSIRRFN